MPWEKSFDKTEVLDRARRAFWAGGYDGTGMAELLAEMGIQKGSFYATFGGKHEVFLEALAGYIDERFAGADGLAKAASPLAALRQHLHDLADHAVGPDGPLGCMLANAAVELAPKDEAVRAVVHKTFDRHVRLYRAALDAAVVAGELPADTDTLGVARGLLALVIGMRVMARAGVPRAAVLAVRDQAVAMAGGKLAGRV